MIIKTDLLLEKEYSDSIINFVRSNLNDDRIFMQNGVSRRYCSVTNKSTEISELCKRIRHEKFNELGINEFIEEPKYGIFIGVNLFSGAVHQHKDPDIDGHYHFRLNFLVSKPDRGGMPVINNKEYSINQGESWVNLASEWYHMSTPVEGNKERIVLSLGAYVKKEIIDSILRKMQNAG